MRVPESRPLASPAFSVPQPNALQESIFLKACRLEQTLHTPVWLMRQAGRYMKEYRALRRKHSFLSLCKDKDLAAEITVTAQEKIQADAAIIFSDILLVLELLGAKLSYPEKGGPRIEKIIEDERQVSVMPERDPAEHLGFVWEAIREARRSLRPNIPLIGFSGAPFTLASYLLEGGKTRDFKRTRVWMASHPRGWQLLMEKLVRVLAPYLQGQIEAGAQALQVFDSWAGYLSREEYQTYVLPHTRSLIDALRGRVPVIHFATRTGKFLDLMCKAGGDVISVDANIPLDTAWRTIGYDRGIQGNLDPEILSASIPVIKRRVRSILRRAAGRPGHIFNLGHGVLPETPVDHVIRMIEIVHEESKLRSKM